MTILMIQRYHMVLDGSYQIFSPEPERLEPAAQSIQHPGDNGDRKQY